jgi:hypothetical protein
VSVLQSPWGQGKMQGISPIQRLFANIRLENTCKYNSVRENSLCGRAENFFARAGNYSRFRPEQGIWAKSIRALALYRDVSSPRTRGRTPRPRWLAILAPLEPLPRSRRSVIVSPRLDTGGRPRMRPQEAGRGLAFILPCRAGGRPGRSWSRAPVIDHPHPRGDPRRSRPGRRRGSPCLLRAPGRSQRRPCGRSSP